MKTEKIGSLFQLFFFFEYLRSVFSSFVFFMNIRMSLIYVTQTSSPWKYMREQMNNKVDVQFLDEP
jgi:hypothetical protein